MDLEQMKLDHEGNMRKLAADGEKHAIETAAWFAEFALSSVVPPRDAEWVIKIGLFEERLITATMLSDADRASFERRLQRLKSIRPMVMPVAQSAANEPEPKSEPQPASTVPAPLPKYGKVDGAGYTQADIPAFKRMAELLSSGKAGTINKAANAVAPDFTAAGTQPESAAARLRKTYERWAKDQR